MVELNNKQASKQRGKKSPEKSTKLEKTKTSIKMKITFSLRCWVVANRSCAF